MGKKETSILTPHQRRVLEALAGERYFAERFYLAGGTALAEFYLRHRLSEDLDLFSEKTEVNPLPIMRFFNIHARELEIRKIETKRVLGLHSFFLHFQDGAMLKVDFNYYPFPRIEKGVRFKQLQVESIYDIGVDKVHTIALRPRARDYIDVYFIVKEKHYDFNDLLMQAKAKFDWDISPIELGARFIEAARATDYPHMLIPINHKEWQQFFVAEARKLKKKIFK